MTQEERRQKNREYREIGAGAMADKRYRLRHLQEIRAKDRERKRRKKTCRDGST